MVRNFNFAHFKMIASTVYSCNELVLKLDCLKCNTFKYGSHSDSTTHFNNIIVTNDVFTNNNGTQSSRFLMDASSIFQLILTSEWLSMQFFSYLTILDIKNIDLACSNHIIRSSWLHCPKLLGTQQIRLFNDHHIDYCIERNLHLTVLVIINPKNTVTNEGFNKLTKQCKFLKKFRLEFNERISSITFAQFIKNCKLLQTFCVDSCACLNDYTLSVIGKYCHQLDTISIFTCSNISIYGLQQMINGCTKLSIFFLKNGNKLQTETDSLLPTLGTCCPQLINLCIKDYVLTSSDIDTFTSGCKNIQSIGLYACRGMNDVILNSIGKHCSSLERFCFGENKNNTIHDVTNIGMRGFLQGCPNLKIFTTDAYFSNLNDITFRMIADNCPKLERLRLDCPNLTDMALKDLGRLKYMKRIYFFADNEFTDDGLLNFVSQGGELDSPEPFSTPSGSSRSSSVSTNSIGKEYPALLKCSNLLETLSIRVDGNKVTSDSVYHIANYCQNLKDVYIVDLNRTVSQKSIDYLLSKCKQLSAVDGTENIVSICRSNNSNIILNMINRFNLSDVEIAALVLLTILVVVEFVLVYTVCFGYFN